MKLNAIILAAGLGRRLAPLTDHLPKPVLPVGGVPLLHSIADKLKRAGAEKIAVNTHHLPEAVRNCAAASPWAEDITLFHEDILLDTAGPLVNAGELLSSGENFLLHNGDVYTDFDLAPMIRKHIETGAVMTMAVLQGPENRLHVQRDRIVDVKGLLGVPVSPESDMYTYACAAVISREFFRFLPDAPVPCHFYEAWEKALRAGAPVVPYHIPAGNIWNDIGSCPMYFAANAHAAGGSLLMMPGAEAEQDVIFTGFNAVSPGARIRKGAKLHNCIVLEGAEVTAGRWSDQVIGRDFVCHRDERELRSLAIFGGETEGLDFSSLEEQGSSRRFYRVSGRGESRILMLSDGADADFGHFLKLGKFFSRHDMLTPEIFASGTAEHSVLMEDLGDGVLYKLLQKAESSERFRLYTETLRALVHFQEQGRIAIGAEDMEYRLFNRKVLLWESEYFTENFLLKLCGLQPDARELEELRRETRAIALAAEKMPAAVMHRDFQSQNIVIKEGKVRFVDFQGSRLGPYTYDAASLIRDPYMALDREMRRRLYDVFYSELQKTGFSPSPADFRRDCLLGALQRNMQALGAYGFLSLVKGKIRYLQYAPPSLAMLQECLNEYSQEPSVSIPVLRKLCTEAEKVLAAKIKHFRGNI